VSILQLGIIMVGAFGVGYNHLGGFPFRVKKDEFNPEAGGGALGACLVLHFHLLLSLPESTELILNLEHPPCTGAWLTMVITYVISLGLAFFIVSPCLFCEALLGVAATP
jgi:hypothetical protein